MCLHLPVPTPRRWAYVGDNSPYALYIVEAERIEAKRKWREDHKRQYVYQIRAHLAVGPARDFEGRVRAMSVMGASYAALKEVKAELKRKRVQSWEVKLTPA